MEAAVLLETKKIVAFLEWFLYALTFLCIVLTGGLEQGVVCMYLVVLVGEECLKGLSLCVMFDWCHVCAQSCTTARFIFFVFQTATHSIAVEEGVPWPEDFPPTTFVTGAERRATGSGLVQPIWWGRREGGRREPVLNRVDVVKMGWMFLTARYTGHLDWTRWIRFDLACSVNMTRIEMDWSIQMGPPFWCDPDWFKC